MKYPYPKSYMLVVGNKATRWWPPIDMSDMYDKIHNLRARGYWSWE
jgi:hypothetical protein